jgi:multiple sugar transport system ATP-binding protein
MAPITLRRVTKIFDDPERPALRELSLEIGDGELLVLLGPSGCGKTTALRCIAGLEAPTTGEIAIGERIVTLLPPADRNVAMVFQNHALYPHFTVRENLAFGLKMRAVPPAEIAQRLARVATRLGLADVLDRAPHELSGGQRQRVALGRAIVREPVAFLFDEPLSNLDVKLRTDLRAELLQVHRELRATMLYVTHDQAEAMMLGQRIAVMHEGRLRQIGTPADVYDQPADVFVAGFLGNPGMNVLPGTAVEASRTKAKGKKAGGEAGRVVECGSLRIPLPPGDYFGQIQLGLRPEHVAVCGVEQGVGNAAVLFLEPLGSDTIVHLDAEGQAIVARLPGRVELTAGELVGLKVDRRKLHLFDAVGSRLP